MAELIAGPQVTRDDFARARRRRRLGRVEAVVKPLSFDLRCAEAFGHVAAAVARRGRKPRGAHAVDLMIAATALAKGLPLYTLNAKDLRGLEGLIRVVDLRSQVSS